jgi:hypothetical protein
MGRYVQDNVHRQREQDELNAERADEAKRQKYAALTTIKDLSKDEFRDMRRSLNYGMPRNASSPHYHRHEQELIMLEKYGILKKNKVAPQHAMDMEHLERNSYFHDALWICERLGLVPLMKIQPNYNIELIQQFYATLVFGTSDSVEFYWMTGDVRCKSDMVEFGALLGYEYKGTADTTLGKRMHVEGVTYSKPRLEPLYDDPKFIPGKAKGLKLLYNILLRLFRESIVPTSGNEDDIRGSLVNLLVYSHRIFIGGKDGPYVKPLDVMDFIYRDMYLCMLDKVKGPMYAPFIMKLIE